MTLSVYKPVAHGGGPLVVLMSRDQPSYRQIELRDESGRVVDVGRYSGRTNGNRPTYRFSRRGSDYPGRVSVVSAGRVYPIGPAGQRRENVGASGSVEGGSGSINPTARATTRPATRPTGAQSQPGVGGLIPTLAGPAVGRAVRRGISGLFGGGGVGTTSSGAGGAVSLSSVPMGATTSSGVGGAVSGGAVSGGGAIAGINAAAPWVLGGVGVLTALDMLANRETGLQKWRRLASEGYKAGQAGGQRPASLLNHFDVPSAPQQAYDMAKAGDPLQYAGGLNPLEAQRRQQSQAKTAIREQGFAPSLQPSRNLYTPKQKAAAKILRPATNSQVNMSNPSILTDADRGR